MVAVMVPSAAMLIAEVSGGRAATTPTPRGQLSRRRDGTWSPRTAKGAARHHGPPETSAINIAADGTITATIPNRTDPQRLGQLELATFINPAGLTSLGNNLLAQSPTSGEPMFFKPGEQGTGTLAQGFLESSNVKAVEEMCR